MSTLVKSYGFPTKGNTNGWVATTDPIIGGDPALISYGQLAISNSSKGRGSPPVSNFVGCLRMTSRRSNTNATSNYWQLSTTWASLGIPAGNVVTEVNLTYMYRWSTACAHNRIGPNVITFTDLVVSSGPAELYNSGGTKLGTFSTLIYCTRRNSGDGFWLASPPGPDPGTTPISQTPAWATATGTSISVPSASQASSSTVKFRINNTLPAASGGAENEFLRYQVDNIVITMTYSSGAVAEVPLIMFSD